MKNILLLVVFSICAVSCGKRAGKGDTEFTVVNHHSGYKYLVTINGEPIYSGTGFSFCSWSGFPLRVGTNTAVYSAYRLEPNSYKTRLDAQMSVEANATPVAFVEMKGDMADEGQYEQRFVFVTDGKSDAGGFVPQGIHDGLTNDICDLALGLVQALATRDAQAIAKSLNAKIGDITNSYPGWCLDTNVPVEMVRVEKKSDMEVVVGQTIALVSPTAAFLKSHPDGGLLSFKNKKADADITSYSLTFARSDGKWFVGHGRQWQLVDTNWR